MVSLFSPMKQFFKMFFASLLAMVVAGVLIIGFIIAGSVALVNSAKKGMTTTEDGASGTSSALVLDLTKTFHEQGERNSLPIGGADAQTAGLYEAVAALREAADDEDIKCLLIKTGGTPNGWATLRALREGVQDFKRGKKTVYAYGESITQRDYYVASAADSVFLNPTGDFELKGLSSQLPFFKGTLDRLGLQPEIFYAGKFKSATEPFRATEMSPENEQQVAAMQEDIWAEFSGAAAAHSGTDTATVGAWTRTGAVQFPQDAERLRLVNGLRYWDEVESSMRRKTGQKGDDEKLATVTINSYASTSGGSASDRVAVLFAEGDITDGTSSNDYQVASETFIKSIRRARDRESIKAVVLRINSPGGSALASEVMLRELQLLRKKKPVVVSMGDVAASGGYYIACAADSIFAEPNTITGSIGVFTVMFNAQKLLNEKLGVTTDGVKNAPYADFPTGSRPLTADEASRVQRSVDTIYAIFKRRVAVARRMSEAAVDSIAQGRVWTGQDAIGIGLVDRIGGLDRAVRSAAALAKLKKDDYGISTYPERVDRFSSMLRRMGGASAAMAVEAALVEEFGEDAAMLKGLQSLRKMHGKAQAAMPWRIEVR